MDYAIQIARGKLIGRKVNTAERSSAVCLDRGALFRLEGDPRGITVQVLEGIAWLTQAGDCPDDILLEKGQAYRIARRGLVLVQGLSAAKINVTES
ncbi:MAG: DUF2917 domain-containing protein [Chloroflexota bacterium]